MWVIDTIDPNFRFEMQGEPVRANTPILLRHSATSNYLGSDLNKYKNDFGQEFELYVSNDSTKNKSQNLSLEKKGAITGDIPSKFQ